MDDTFNVKGSGAGIVLVRLGDIIIEHALKFEFTANNNQAEYEVFITGMVLDLEMRATRLKFKSDS